MAQDIALLLKNLDSKILKLQIAKEAMRALCWVEETKTHIAKDDVDIASCFNISIQWGAATDNGKAARQYFRAAIEDQIWNILDIMGKLAQDDVNKASEE